MTLHLSDLLSLVALGVSVTTAWLTLFQLGTVKMTQPTMIALLAQGADGPKVFLRTLLYCTARRGQVIEDMFVRLHRQDFSRLFNLWHYGDGPIVRGSGLRIGYEGVAVYHHFVLSRKSPAFEFTAGKYTIEVFARPIQAQPVCLGRYEVALGPDEAAALKNGQALFFNWDSDAELYFASAEPPPAKFLPQ
jgi:hypothetical protein